MTMTTELTKAAQQALEALESASNGLTWYQQEHPEDGSPADEEMHEALNQAMRDLRNALTQRPAAQTEREAWAPYLVDRADGVKGHYAIGRWNPRGYREVWNLHTHQWAAYSDDVMSLEEADSLLRQITIPTVRASLPAPQQATPHAETDWISNVIRDVSELPDRSSPDDEPDMMLVTAEELRSILEAHTPQQATPTEQERDDAIRDVVRVADTVEEAARFGVNAGIRLARTAKQAAPDPIPMVLHCPKCGMQHVDKPDAPLSADWDDAEAWTNPPHRSHLCHGCGTIWRPAEVPTVGVKAISTKGKADTWEPGQAATPEPVGEPDTVPLDALHAAERERDYWKTRARAMLDHAEGTCWYWMGDGEDHLESLVSSLPVVIRADQLRELLARPAPGVPAKLPSAYATSTEDGTWRVLLAFDNKDDAEATRRFLHDHGVQPRTMRSSAPGVPEDSELLDYLDTLATRAAGSDLHCFGGRVALYVRTGIGSQIEASGAGTAREAIRAALAAAQAKGGEHE